MGRIVHGNENFGYAEILVENETLKFGSPIMLPGMVSFSMEVEQSSTPIYADNKTYCIVTGAKVRTAEAAVRYISRAYAALALGFKEQANSMMVDTGSAMGHCIFFETTEFDCSINAETKTLHYLYDVTANEPSLETATDEEEVEAAELAVPYTAKESAFVLDENGKAVQYGYITRTTENAALYDTFKTSVILPTDVI